MASALGILAATALERAEGKPYDDDDDDKSKDEKEKKAKDEGNSKEENKSTPGFSEDFSAGFSNSSLVILFFIVAVLANILLVLSLLLGIAFFTLWERQILAAIQRRLGPNAVGFYGIVQPITDGVKLLGKESVIPKSANESIFLLAPNSTFGLALSG